MCTVSINVDEATVQLINPGLTSRESISNWLQHQVDLMMKEMAHDRALEGVCFPLEQDIMKGDEETISVEELRAMLHETVRKEYALP